VRPLRAFVLVLAVVRPTLAVSGEDRLDVNLRWDLPITAAAAGLSVGLSNPSLSPGGSDVFRPGGLDEETREHLRLDFARDARGARLWSDLVVNYGLPAGALLASGAAAWREGRPRTLLEDAVVVAQAATIAADLNALSKDLVARRRPDGGGRSFYSSHTSRAFALATAVGTVSTLRGRDSAPWLWAGGLTLATGVAYLRVAGDAHWLTDVAAGAAIGGAVGFAVPWLFHQRRGRHRFDVRPALGGVAVVF
jgi:membrane-associated phospholipid phosphatase